MEHDLSIVLAMSMTGESESAPTTFLYTDLAKGIEANGGRE